MNSAHFKVTCRHIIERDAHVSWPLRRCARHVIGRLRGGIVGYRALPRDARRALWEGAAEARQSNRDLYTFATGSIR